MSNIDPTVAKVLDKDRSKDEDEDEDALLEKLESDTAALDAFREKRMQQLHDELHRARVMQSLSHGAYTPATTEREVLTHTTTSKFSIVHFFHKDFNRCKIMDSHLEVLARKHFDTKFTSIDVEKAPFLVERLKVRVLPCVIAFVDGKSVDRIEGFAELGNTDGFTTKMLELRLLACGVLVREKVDEDTGVGGGGSGGKKAESDDGDDWD
ncbi:thioredoxin-like protein [Choiromyces venosus 120613-1]|uniref:Thioredoxin-like protein n=1 Tax=Choiromyces venosus 120613-1 TaxID=1336337 RepID=A0A3N4J4F0_9PEZI|nr:thioredoxin-like protein [Choiromyces venosus 120613-1]